MNRANQQPADLNSDLTILKGIGEKTAGLFRQCGIETVGDLLTSFPRSYDRYEDPVTIAELSPGETAAVAGTIKGPVRMGRNRKLAVTSTMLADLTGTVNVVWFRIPYISKTIRSGQAVILRGSCQNTKRGLTLSQPEIFTDPAKYSLKLHSMQPVYRRTGGLSNQAFIKAVREAMPLFDQIEDPVDPELLKRYQLMPLSNALKILHFPEKDEAYIEARNRLCFDEFLEFILKLRLFRSDSSERKDAPVIRSGKRVDKLIGSLPYQLTSGQRHALDDISEDLASGTAMSRLIQGDVGCGKTIVALLALLSAVDSGCQGALMAPTQVLALQHYETIRGLFDRYHIDCDVDLLTGDTKASARNEIYRKMADGAPQIFIGTQTLIQQKASFANIGLVVTDEQHRFGVRQRLRFAEKGSGQYAPHILVMSATPIPRTLGMIMYGDLSISLINELPQGRLPIKNAVMNTQDRNRVIRFIEKQIADGHQVYCICPLVEESESLDAEAVTTYVETLKDSFEHPVSVGMLHGRMAGSDKEKILSDFSDGKLDILVSTTVVEVGINVPNATVMMIENADRFGLAQLHQLRGRIGRGSDQSYCIFLTSKTDPKVVERLNVIGHCNDGFKIAEEDMKMRGPGDLFGMRQSGFMDFTVGDIFQDHAVLEKASDAANRILTESPDLSAEKYRLLKKKIDSSNDGLLTMTERTL